MEYQINSVSFLAPEFKIMMQALSILDCSKTTVVRNFSHHSINFIPDPLNLDKELMEIRFNDVTVTYVINNQDICCTGYLFFDDISDLESYLDVCNKCFETVTPNSWKYKDCCIELLKEGKDFYFVFTPISLLSPTTST